MSRGIQTKKGTYRKANMALGLSALGLFAAYPFQTTFWGGLLSSGCSAALVGGLADWFAVNALFRRPLGVRPGRIFRTEIIPRNRERIFAALSDMVQTLLSQESLKKKLGTYDFANVVTKIWETGGKERCEEPLSQLLQAFLSSLSSGVESLVKEIEPIWEDESLRKEAIDSLLGQVLDRLLASEEGRRAVETLISRVGNWVQDPEVHHWIAHWLEKSIHRYVNENPSRKFLVMFLPNPSALAAKIQGQLVDYFLGGSAADGAMIWLKEKRGQRQSLTLESDVRVQQTLGAGSEKIFNLLREKAQQAAVYALHEKIEAPGVSLKLSRWGLNQVEIWVTKLKEIPEERAKFNRQMQILLFPLLEKQHGRIGKIVREGLERYSDEMLVELIEQKTGDDLQMIRINGSVVGGLVGMMIYILTHFL